MSGPTRPDDTYQELAVYNAECWRGIVHTAEMDARMALLQADFNAAERARWEEQECIVVEADSEGGEAE